MSDTDQGSAATPAEGTTADKVAETGAEQQVTETRPEGEAKAEEAGDKPEGEGDKRKNEPGSVRQKRRLEVMRAELAERDRRIEELQRQVPKAEGEQEKAPKEEDFGGDWTKYMAAVSAFEARQAIRDEFSKRESKEGESRRVEANRERTIAHLERLDEAREVITDFDQVMAGMKGVNVSNEVIEEIISSDKSALLSYHLAKNPEKLRELNAMSSRELAREIGRLEGSIRMPAGKKQTTAPPPPSQVGGSATSAVDLSKADMDAYVAERRKQGYGQR